MIRYDIVKKNEGDGGFSVYFIYSDGRLDIAEPSSSL